MADQLDLRTSDEQDDDQKQKTAALSDDDLFTRLKAWFKTDRDHCDDWRIQAREDYDFVAGEQWDAKDKEALRAQMRPVIVFNRVEPVISAVSGTEISNRQEVRFLPRSEGDAQVDEMLTNAAKWFREQCDAEDEESDSFVDLLTCGMGWTETRMDFETNDEGEPIVDRVDPFEMYWDAASRKRNLADSRRMWRVRKIPIEAARALIGDDGEEFDDEDLDATWALGDQKGDPKETRQESRFYRKTNADGDGNEVPGTVTLIEVQWYERESLHIVADPTTGETIKLKKAEFAKLNKRMGELGMALKSVAVPSRVYKRAYLGKIVLKKEDSPFKEHFSFKCMTGKRDRNKGTFYGLVRPMKDPQRWANKWLSQTLHIMNVNAKGGIMAEKGSFDDDREAEKTYANPQAITWLAKGTLTSPNGAKIKEKPQAQFPVGYQNLLEFAISSIRDASGVNLELLGMKETDQAGVLEAQRKKQAMAILANMFDSLRRYRKDQGRLMLFIIQNFIPEGTLIRIVGEEGEKFVPLVHTPGLSKFDVIVDDAPSSPQQKDVTWALIQQMLPMVKEQMTPELWAALLPYSPLPPSVVTKIQKMITDSAASREGTQQAMQELEKWLKIAQVNKDQSTADMNQAKAASLGYDQVANLYQMLQGGGQPQQQPQQPGQMQSMPQLQSQTGIPGTLQ